MKWTFDNGYGASVIDNGYGSLAGLKELAVLHDGGLCFESPITDDVIGWLTDDEVNAYLDKIRQLPRNDACSHSRKVPA